jgi:hypothetical protein
VLVDEPYYLEPGYEAQRGKEHGRKLARDYNENAVLYALTVCRQPKSTHHSVQSFERLATNPVAPFEREIREHLCAHYGA